MKRQLMKPFRTHLSAHMPAGAASVGTTPHPRGFAELPSTDCAIVDGRTNDVNAPSAMRGRNKRSRGPRSCEREPVLLCR